MSSAKSVELNSSAQIQREPAPYAKGPVFWRVEGSLLNLTAVRPVGFFTWNAQTFLERWARRGAMGVLAIGRPFFYATHRVFATRVLHAVLRGVSRDRLDLLGEEYFEYVLEPRINPRGVERLKAAMANGADIVLVSQGLDHVMRPLARHLGVRWILCNRLDFRDGIATGRLLDPVIRPRGVFARLRRHKPDGSTSRPVLLHDLGLKKRPAILEDAIQPTERPAPTIRVPVVHFNSHGANTPMSVRKSLGGKEILLIGGTGFIGKVWLANLLTELPEIGRVHLLIRRHRSATALERFQRAVEESPVFEKLAERHGDRFSEFLRERVTVIDGDVTKPSLGLPRETAQELAASLDVIINSSGLTDFNPDLRDALTSNVRATTYLLDFLRQCRHAALLHLSTCYVVGRRDGRVIEQLPRNYTPVGLADFDAEQEWHSLEALVRDTEARAESPEVAEELRRAALEKEHAAKDLRGAALENQIRKNRFRWIRETLTRAGIQRASELGWPNTYTFTKSLAESLIRNFLDANPRAAIAVVRPAIVESSIEKPFLGWNEGINTSASLSYLLGTFFRQLPTTETKCLDLIPVDLVCRGMTLIAAALVNRRHAPVYQLATSVANPCDMRRSIELTGLGHRKFYRAQDGFQHRIRAKFDAIPVSKARYETLSAPAQKAIIQAIGRSMEPLRLSRKPFARRERELEKVIKLIDLFEPFILHNDHVFEAANVERLDAALPPDERADFGYDARSLDWWDYWINVHIPALRKWCYPLIEGRQPESRPRRSVPLAVGSEADAAGATRAGPAAP
ncbi:MAG TPA: SDR family oxidoreductase [Candidatus Limnocylindrales bacterium]|nr:SDR family oxidoreductase [Candidatus Limnocylindrales bacterium]